MRRASRANDSGAARGLLQRWLRRYPRGGDSLRDFADAVDDPALRDSLRALDSDGFRPDGEGGWDGRAFWALFEKWLGTRSRRAGESMPDPTDLYAPENRRI